MNVEIRIYKKFDTDILALYDAGYPIMNMMRQAIIAYANGTPLHYYIDEVTDFDLNDKTSVRVRINIPNNEINACYMLNNIKHGYKNTFCKVLFRNSLVFQNLFSFFADKSLGTLVNANVNSMPLAQIPNLIPCSQLEKHSRQLNVFGKSINIANKQAVTSVTPTIQQAQPVFVPPVQNQINFSPPQFNNVQTTQNVTYTPTKSKSQQRKEDFQKKMESGTNSADVSTVENKNINIDKSDIDKAENMYDNTIPISNVKESEDANPDDLMAIFDAL